MSIRKKIGKHIPWGLSVIVMGNSPCKPGQTLKRLLKGGHLSRFLACIRDRGSKMGIGPDEARALLLDLMEAGERGWCWCESKFTPVPYEEERDRYPGPIPEGPLSWLECQGWAVDAAFIDRPELGKKIGASGSVLYLHPAGEFRKTHRVRDVTVRTMDAAQNWIERHEVSEWN